MSQPYENTLSLDELRREVRYQWDHRQALVNALRDVPEVPPTTVLSLLSGASKWPEDHNLGVQQQRQHGLDAVPPKTEYECGAGVWVRIRNGLRGAR